MKLFADGLKFRVVPILKNRLGLAIMLVFSLMLVQLPGSGVGAQESNKAGLVVRLGDDQFLSRCVSFSEESLSGMELLRRSGLALDTKVEGMGSLVCSIENTGCPADDCFCNCSGGGDCIYWSYWGVQEEGWRYARVGATQNQLQDGDIDGWSWGPGSLTEAIAPPEITIDEICSSGASNSAGAVTDADQAPDLIPYVVFGATMLILGGVLMVRRRGNAA